MEPSKSDQKYIQMTQTPVERLITRLAGPSIVCMLITTIYNLADTFFIGRLSTSAAGAVGVAFPMMAVIQALGFFFGQGSGASLSQALGSRDEERARELGSVGLFSALICGAVFGVTGMLLLEHLVYWLGATDTIYPYCRDYLRLIFIGAPWMTGSFVLNNILRFQGNSFFGMIGLLVGGLLNIVLDPILIFVFDMGISGAALATIFSQAVGFGTLLYLCNTRSSIRISWRSFRPGRNHYAAITRSGLPSLLRQGVASVAFICLNVCARPFGDPAIAAMAIVSKITNFSNSAMLGFGQGFQPVCGYNYGAKLFDRVKRGFRFCVRVSFAALAVFALAEFLFADEIIAIFRKEDPEVIAIGAKVLRYQCLTLVFNSVIISGNMLLQTTGRMGPASLIGISRQGLFLIPLLFLLTRTLGLTGLQIAQPIADTCTFFLTLPLVSGFLHTLDDPFERLPDSTIKD